MATNIPIFDEAVARLMMLDQASVLALADVAQERLRQIEGENWSPAHDDAHAAGELATAGACYAAERRLRWRNRNVPSIWPWSPDWWKPKSINRNYVRGAALIVAEMAKHYRSAPSTS